MNINHFVSELKRRNVFKVSAAYAIAGWLVIQVMATVSPQFNFPTWVPPLFTTIVLCGFPIALIIAWAFEITPEGLKKTAAIDRTKSLTVKTGKKLNRLLITVLSLAIVFLAVERIFYATGSQLANEDEELPSIAVLPFVNMSSDKENEYFSDGLSEELLNVLAKVEDLRVAGRTSSFKFKGHNDDMTKIGNELHVSHLLEGSVRKSSNTVRITAQLIKVSDGYHMWSETYERELTPENLFDIQDEISMTVLKELKVRMLLTDSTKQKDALPTDNLEAYEKYLEATQLIIATDIKDIEKAIDLFKEAISLDPEFVDAYARLAKAYHRQLTYGNVEEDDIKELMRINIDKAMLIDGNSARALDAQGKYYTLIHDHELMLSTYEKAIKLMPNDGDVLDGYHTALEHNDQMEKSTEVMKKAYEQDPLNPDYATHYTNHLIEDSPEEALQILDEVIKNNPEYSDAYFAKAHLMSSDKFKDMAKGFELTYEGYQFKSEDLGMIGALYGSALDMAFSELALSMEDKMAKLFPKNALYTNMRLTNRMLEKDFKAVEKILNEDTENEFFDERNKAYLRSLISFENEDFEDALSNYIKSDSTYLSDTLKFEEPYQSFNALEYAALLKANGKQEDYDSLKTKICDYTVDLEMEEDKKMEYKYAHFACFVVTDEDKAIDYFRELYFDDYDKIHTPTALELNMAFLAMGDNPKFVKLREEIYQDLHSMSANAIESLKKRGIWKEDEMSPVKLDQNQ